jgi:cellobiose phosphorylase
MAFAALGDNRRAWELFSMINPVNHSLSIDAAERYKVEPYVVAADVYASSSHVGRGGWTWYTGSAGWMYRLVLESLIGLRLEGTKMRFEPCLPADWPSITILYRYRDTHYHIVVTQVPTTDDLLPGSVSVRVDGTDRPDAAVPLVDDRQAHSVEVSSRAGRRKE